ncbi:MAG TPA: hypothetical protein VGR57_00075, partial [Ktedonobacterales bacterium]|nr:hypothetical protein [Ktedonobacterales bacterium]
MAKLKRAVSDGHYYVLAGQHYGTWQVSEQGVRELERSPVQMPRAGHEGVHLPRSWWRYLWDEGLLFKHDIPYDHRERLSNGAEDDGAATLSLLLRPQRSQPLSWSLALELTAIPEGILAEAQKLRAFFVSANDALATRTLVSQLKRDADPARVAPQPAPYAITWFDSAARQLDLPTPCFAAGLRSTSQGNVFAEGHKQNWRRCLPGTAVAYWGTLYWLARAEHDPHWPGKAQHYGAAQDGWQLWRLSTDESQPISMKLIADWLRAREITLSPHTQRLSLVTPPQAIMEDGWALVSGNQALIIGCAPPERITPGVRPRLDLTVTRVNGD